MDKLLYFIRLIVGVILMGTFVVHGELCECSSMKDMVSTKNFNLEMENAKLYRNNLDLKIQTMEIYNKLTERVEVLENTRERDSESTSFPNKDNEEHGVEKKATLADLEMKVRDKYMADHRALNNMLAKALRAEKLERLRLERKIEEGLDRINNSYKEIDEHVQATFASYTHNISWTMEDIKKKSFENGVNLRNDVMDIAKRLELQTIELVNETTAVQTAIDGINQDVSKIAADISTVIDIVLLDQKAVCEPNCTNGGVCFMDGSCICRPLTEGSRCERFVCDDECLDNEGECVGPGLCKCPRGQHGYNCEHETKASDCYDLLLVQSHPKSGIYQVLLKGSDVPIDVYCDMETDGGGWTIFQNRFDGSVDFYREFTEYVNGFGKVNGEFWLGLENIYRLISHGQSELRIDMSRANGIKGYTTYRAFSLSAGPDYELRVSHETAGNLAYDGYDDWRGLYGNNGALFSTYDRDRDTSGSVNCASSRKGGWWYRYCTNVNLNGLYCTPGTDCGWKGMYYYQFAGKESLKTSRMMVRRHHSNK